MAVLTVATAADLGLVLPTVLVADFLQHHGLLPDLTKVYRQTSTLRDGLAVQFESADQESLKNIARKAYGKRLENDKWLAKGQLFAEKTSFHELDGVLGELDLHLTQRTHLTGFDTGVSDILIWALVRANGVALSLVKKHYANARRWYDYVQDANPWIAGSLAELLRHAREDKARSRAAASAAGASYDIDLPALSGPVVTRFPPEPSGYLHVGHAKAALLNEYFARREPGGTLICRFDDTNPSKETAEFQDSIVEDLRRMQVVPDRISHSSDYFQVMYEYAVRLIRDGKAFADDSALGKGDEERRMRLPSKRRDLGVEETLARFDDMKSGSEEGQRWCLRARIAYDSPNGTLRDPVIYRCNPAPHHRTGTSWKMYPTYDFCAPILDSVEGVTLALRTNEYRDRNAQYAWFQDALGLRRVDVWDFSRLNFVRTVLSKRKLARIVGEGRVQGWDDPRMPTVRGMLRRGVAVGALREFVLRQGPSRNILNLEWGAFWALNRKYVDPTAARHTAILCEGVVRCTVEGFEGGGSGVLVRPKYHKNPDLGTKEVVTGRDILIEGADAASLAVDEEITLMNWGNAFVRAIQRDDDGRVAGLSLQLHLDGDVKKTKKITWLAHDDPTQTNTTAAIVVPVDLVSFDHLIAKDKLEKGDALEDCLTPVTEFRARAWADGNVKGLGKGDVVQFERKGYYVFDGVEEDGEGVSRRVFFEIPSGKA